MAWDIKCTQRRFFVEELFTTRISIESTKEKILIASCYFTGVYLKRDSILPFLETERVILDVNKEKIDSATFSLFLPKDIPPSYSGANISVVYNLHVNVQGSESAHTSSFMCSVISGIPICFESSAKMSISEKYENVDGPEDSLTHTTKTNYCYRRIVEALREKSPDETEPNEFILATKKSEKVLGDVLNQLPVLAKSFWTEEKEMNQHPLRLYSKLTKNYSETPSRKAIYSITSNSVEYAKAYLSYTEEDPPYCLLNLHVILLEKIENIQISLIQVETVDETEERSTFYTTSKDVEYAKKIFFEIPLDRARNPTIVTPRFSTQVELKIDINNTHTARLRIK